MVTETIPAKSLLSAYQSRGWFASNYTMNIYRGCSHGCIYCDSRSKCYGIEDFDTVRSKDNALILLEKELRSKRRKGIILTGSMSDPYNPLEASEQLTQKAIGLINKYGFGIVILTKSALVKRDLDLLLKVKEHSPAVVNFTVTTCDDMLCRKIEPGASPASERFAAMQFLSQNGIICGVLLLPVLPFITDTEKNMEEIANKAAQAGARWIYAEGPAAVSLRDRQKEYFYRKLQEEFPNLKERYLKQYPNQFWCVSPQTGLKEVLKKACDKYTLLNKSEDIDHLIKQCNKTGQLELFNLA